MSPPIFRTIRNKVHAFFTHEIDGPARRRSRVFAEIIDVGALRRIWHNHGEIAPGVYRSNNPNHKRLAARAAAGLKTVVNLRDDMHRAPFKFTRESCAKLGLGFVSFPMAPRRAPTRDELIQLLDLFPTLEKPVLFHCKSGADRTGLVGALWMLDQEGAPLDVAREELSLRYLHRRDSETGVLDVVLDLFAESGQGDLRRWIESEYDPDTAQARAQSQEPQRSLWQSLRSVAKDLYRYGQHREAVWHASYEGPLDTPDAKARAEFFTKWIDHGALRSFWTNEAEIAPGLIRANHPTERRLRAHAARGLKTVINLRGASMQPQYQLEKKLCDELGLTLVDYPLAAHAAPSVKDALTVLDLMNKVDRPALMHCKSGADRTGIASALYVLDQGGTVEQARAQLSLRFVHLKNGSKGVLDRVIDAYAAQDKPLRDWLQSDYDPQAIQDQWAKDRA